MKKTSCRLLTKVKLLTSQQMDRMLPRGARTSHRIVSPFLHHHSSFSSSSTRFALHHHSISKSLTFVSSFNTHHLSSQSNMEKHPQDTKEKVKDEGYSNGASDHNPTKGVSDYILPHILNLYASRATPQDFEIYAPNATFEDPLMCAHGVKQIKSAFYSLNKAFSESRIVDYTIHENVISPGKMEILIDNKQYYKFLGKDINMISLIKLYTEDGKIVRHEDCWDKKPLWNSRTVKAPLIGHITDATKRASMFATHAFMRFGKDPTM